ncbi:unnamed protein product, partial [Onchocerca flexuosa]|uniref:DUF5641 domain-containing protein n=1 Tax=Onchocerca flexuosa TaxID=387005 RepID=A0A183I5F3_9BILA
MVWKNTVPKAPWGGNESELITLIAEIEGILNTRPLTSMGFDDYRVIRPIDFISPNAPLDIPTNYEKRRSPHENEIIFLNEPDILRGMWKLARIKAIKRGWDGKIRTATIQLPNGKLLDISINELYPLEVDDSERMEDQSTPIVGEPKEEPIALRIKSAQTRQTKLLQNSRAMANSLLLINTIFASLFQVTANDVENSKLTT